MAGNVDPKQPVEFELPDGDIVLLPTWDYIMAKFETGLNPTLQLIETINESLSNIDVRLNDWFKD